MARIAFCLSGGGAKGDFEVGALTFLYRKGLVPNIVCGTSVGAVNAAAIAEGPTGIARLRNVWQSLQHNGDMYEAEPWFKEVLSVFGGGGGGGPDLDLVRAALFSPAFPLAAIKINDLLNLIQKLMADYNAGKIRGLFNLSPTRALLTNSNNGLRPDDVAESGIALRLATVCLQSGDVHYVTETGRLFKGRADKVPSNAPTVKLADGVLASSAIPLIFNPIKLADKHYVDAGIREVTPLRAALELGAEQVYAVVASETRLATEFTIPEHVKSALKVVGLSTEPVLRIDGIGKRALGIMLDEITSNDLVMRAKITGTNAVMWTIQPTIVPELHDALTIDPALIRLAMAYGYMRAWDAVGIPGGGHNAVLNLPQNTELRRAYRENTDEIVKLRNRAITLERASHTTVSGGRGPGAATTMYNADKIAELRTTKNAIAAALNARRKLAMYERDALPPDEGEDTVASWAHGWETKQPETLVKKPPATPFSDMPGFSGSIAAATPPIVDID